MEDTPIRMKMKIGASEDYVDEKIVEKRYGCRTWISFRNDIEIFILFWAFKVNFLI